MTDSERAALDRLLGTDYIVDAITMALKEKDTEKARRAFAYMMEAMCDGESSIRTVLPCGKTAHDLLYTHLIVMSMVNPVVGLSMAALDHGQMIQDLMGHMYQFGYAVGRRDGELSRMVGDAIGGAA